MNKISHLALESINYWYSTESPELEYVEDMLKNENLNNYETIIFESLLFYIESTREYAFANNIIGGLYQQWKSRVSDHQIITDKHSDIDIFWYYFPNNINMSTLNNDTLYNLLLISNVSITIKNNKNIGNFLYMCGHPDQWVADDFDKLSQLKVLYNLDLKKIVAEYLKYGTFQ